jgi:hypothetical protein
MPTINLVLNPQPPNVQQDNQNACWAAVSASVFAWRNGILLSPAQAAAQLGAYFAQLHSAGLDLPVTDIGLWASAAAFQQLPPTNISIPLVSGVLGQNKPLIVVKASSNPALGHVVVVSNLVGDGTSGGTKISFMDPDLGQQSTLVFSAFASQFEHAAPGPELYAQLLRPL